MQRKEYATEEISAFDLFDQRKKNHDENSNISIISFTQKKCENLKNREIKYPRNVKIFQSWN